MSNGLRRLRSYELVEARRVPREVVAKSGKKVHRGFKYMWRITPKGLRYIGHTSIKAFDIKAVTERLLTAYAKTTIPKELLAIAPPTSLPPSLRGINPRTTRLPNRVTFQREMETLAGEATKLLKSNKPTETERTQLRVQSLRDLHYTVVSPEEEGREVQMKLRKVVQDEREAGTEPVKKEFKKRGDLIVADFVDGILESLNKLSRDNKNAGAKLEAEKALHPSLSQEPPIPDEALLIRQAQLLLVHEVVETKSRITLDAASAKLGVSPDSLKSILPQIVEGLDLRLGGFDGPFSVRHRAWKY